MVKKFIIVFGFLLVVFSAGVFAVCPDSCPFDYNCCVSSIGEEYCTDENIVRLKEDCLTEQFARYVW